MCLPHRQYMCMESHHSKRTHVPMHHVQFNLHRSSFHKRTAAMQALNQRAQLLRASPALPSRVRVRTVTTCSLVHRPDAANSNPVSQRWSPLSVADLLIKKISRRDGVVPQATGEGHRCWVLLPSFVEWTFDDMGSPNRRGPRRTWERWKRRWRWWRWW